MTQRMNTRLIVSAEDRGVSRLLNRLGAESDATVKSFGKLGAAFTTLVGGFTVGYGVKQALSWVDDYRMDVLSIATTLSDTWKDTGKSMTEVFTQNKVHADEFFKLLRRQARQSISSFEELRSAYAIFASKGMALDVVEDQAKMFATLVDRITLATKGQNKAVQVQQELRAILEGRARPSDVLAKIFVDRDAAFISNMKKLVAERNVTGIINYMSELMSDVPLDKELGKLLSKQLANVQDDVRFWAKDAFAPLYEVLIDIVGAASSEIASQDSPLMRGLEGVINGMAEVLKKTREVFAGFGSSEMGRFLIEAAPRFIVTTAAVLATAKAFTVLATALKAAALASTAGLGAVAIAAGAVVVGGGWAAKQQTREQAKTGGDPLEYNKAFYADAIEGLISVIKGVVTAATELMKNIINSIAASIKTIKLTLTAGWESVKAIFYNLGAELLQATKGFFEKYLIYGVTFFYDVRKLLQWVRHPMDKSTREYAQQTLEMEKYQVIARLPKELPFMEAADSFRQKAAGASKVAEGLEKQIAEQLDFTDFIKGAVDAYKLGYDVMIEDTIRKQAGRAAAADKAAADKAVADKAAMTGKPGVNVALIDSAISASTKALEGLAKSGANLDAVIAQMESATLKGGDDFAYALSQVSKEYANYKAKIVRFAGGQEDSLAALLVEQSEVQQAMAASSGMEREILQAKNQMLAVAKDYARLEQAALAERNLQTELERQMTEAQKDEANALNDRIIASKQSEQAILESSTVVLKALNDAKRDVALLTVEKYREETRATKVIAEADRLEGKYLSLRSLQAGLPGKGGTGIYAAQAAMEALSLQQQIIEISRSFDIAGAKESEAAAQERLNRLQAQYRDLFKDTADEAAAQVERLNDLAMLADSGTMAAGFIAAMEEMKLAAKDAFTHIKDLTVDVFDAMQNTMSDVFFDAFSGKLDDAKDYFSAFGKSIVALFSSMLAKMAMDQLKKVMTRQVIGGVLSLFSMGGSGGTVTAGAMGGVAEGGFRAFASGGIVRRPTLGLIGEGAYNEAVVPLPDGRSIPVAMHGGGAGSVTVNVIDNSGAKIEKTVNKEIDEQGNMVIDIMLDAIARNKRGARAQFKSVLGVS